MDIDVESSSAPILRTKLQRPQVTADLVCRPRLHELLDAALACPLALVSAPAGYGKSMLVSQWAESREEPCAWLSLDDTDGEPLEFLRYVVAALRTLFPAACAKTGTLLKVTDPPPLAVLASTLVNELDALEEPFLLVLDDYYRLGSSAEVHEVLRRVLRHPPRTLRLVIVTRRDPPLPLATLRAGGRLSEVRLEDLRFSRPETAALLASTPGLAVSDEAVANLWRQVEGWAVGLRLAVLASRQMEDPDAFLKDLRGGVHHAQEFLVHEVVAKQPPEMQERLLEISVLDRFCPGLCEAMWRAEEPSPAPGLDGRAFTRELQQRNLFCISLDARGEWFRFHHLFQDLLRLELGRQQGPEAVAALHRRASRWFAAQGHFDEAIRHALAAGDAEGAARLVERRRMPALDTDRLDVLVRWMALLPETEVKKSPALLLARAWTFYFKHRSDLLLPLLVEIEALVGPEPSDKALAGELDCLRGYFHLFQGDGRLSREHLERADRWTPESFHRIRGEIVVFLALARQMEGRAAEARRALEVLAGDVDYLQPIPRSRVAAALVFVNVIAGDLTRASSANRWLRQAAVDGDSAYALSWSNYSQGLVHFYRHELEPAESSLARAVAQRHIMHRRAASDAMVGLALTQEGLGRSSEAEATLGLLFDYAGLHHDSEALAIAESCRQRLAVVRGSAADGLPAPSDSPVAVIFWLEVPAVTRCRVLLAETSTARLEGAERLLEECLELNRGQHNVRQEIEILPLLALARQKQGRTEDGLALLERAVTLAAPGGWVRPFVEPGPTVADLLQQLVLGGGEADLVHRVLAVCEEANDAAAPPELDVRGAPTPPPGVRLAAPDLTHRERDVLELLARRMRDKEIAAELGVSPVTVKSHLRSLYQKLQAGNRRQAVAEAEALGILPRR